MSEHPYGPEYVTTEADDGSTVTVHVPSGQIVEAFDRDSGEEIDPEEFSSDGPAAEPAMDPRLAEILARIEFMEAQQADAAAAHQQRMASIPQLGPLDTQQGIERAMATLDTGADAIARKLGRTNGLTLNEKRPLQEGWFASVEAGSNETVEDVFVRLCQEGVIDTAPIADTDEGRRALYNERFADGDQLAAAERGESDLLLPADQQPFNYRGADLDSDAERQEAMAALVQGRPDSGGDAANEQFDETEDLLP